MTSIPDYRSKIRFIIKLGHALHECGASSELIERHLTNVTHMLEINGSFLISPTTFTCAFWEDDKLDQFTHIERVKPCSHDMGRLWEIDRLVESMEEGLLNFDESRDKLNALNNFPPYYSKLWHAFAWALAGGAFAALLSPNALNYLAASLISLILFFIVTFITKKPRWEPVTTIVGAFVAGIFAGTLSHLGIGISPPFVILSSIILFIPGLALTIALTEISHGHLVSGSSRLVDAIMTLLKLFFGTLSGLAVISFLPFPDPQTIQTLPPISDWRIWPALIGLSLSLGIAFNLPWRKMPWGILSAGIAFSSAKIGEIFFGMYAGMFLGALAVGLYSNAFARLIRGPGSVLMIHGIILLVPGSKVYGILNHWVYGETSLPYESASKALMAFVALIAGLLFSNAFLPARKTL